MRIVVFVAALLLAPAAQAQTLADMHWLKGCWRTQGDGPQITEVWLAPPMPAMVGYAYTVENGEVQSWEQMRIEENDNWLTFVAMPGGGAPVRFTMHAGAAPGRIRFDNPQHDYPQTVRYERTGSRLTATISGAEGANPIAFNYRRISCSGALRP